MQKIREWYIRWQLRRIFKEARNAHKALLPLFIWFLYRGSWWFIWG